MAAATTSTRATTPTGTEPFPKLDTAPHTPSSISGNPAQTSTAPAADISINPFANPFTNVSQNQSLLQPPAKAALPAFTTADISPKSDKAPFSPRRSPVALTGVAAMADARRKKQQDNMSRQTTPNPAVEAIHTLMGGGGLSRPTDAPAPNKLSEPMRKAAEQIQIPMHNRQTDSIQASPTSMSSFGGTAESSIGNNGALTATSNGTATTASDQPYVAEPAEMTDVNHDRQDASPNDDSRIAFSYPGPPPPNQHQQNNHDSTPHRGMSLPGAGFQDNKSSPASGNKRHKCPYCDTDFTRHHNLKSHLLTHSQEKPYVCPTCQARFRRLHDLKRHTKLHTGEKPHTCEKCGRKFARGDALARHNKGPGGCAGRRSSFGGEDEFGEDGDGMDGVEYTGDDGNDASLRRVSEPSRKRVHVEQPLRSTKINLQTTLQHISTCETRDGTTFSCPSCGSMTESPKPLSPGQPQDQGRLGIDVTSSAPLGRNRSPSLTTQFQQTHFGRGSGGRTPPQSQFGQQHMSQQAPPQLPPLSLSTSASGRPSLSGPGPSMLHHQQVPPGNMSGPNSASSHGQSSGNSMRDIIGVSREAMNMGNESELWSHIRELESKFSRMRDEYELRMSRLNEEVISLRAQLNNATSGGQQGSYPAIHNALSTSPHNGTPGLHTNRTQPCRLGCLKAAFLLSPPQRSGLFHLILSLADSVAAREWTTRSRDNYFYVVRVLDILWTGIFKELRMERLKQETIFRSSSKSRWMTNRIMLLLESDEQQQQAAGMKI
ncbi:hypothetical protein MRB53_037756 [Persea americana]|nr:hypothetical protein MRB53_037756 [Persea americana]